MRFLLLLVLLSGCSSVTHKRVSKKVIPELGTIGVFKNYLFQDIQDLKTVVSLEKAVRIKFNEIEIRKRAIFSKKDSLQKQQQDSILISLTILDNVGLIEEIKQDKKLVNYLKKNSNYKIVTEVNVHFPRNILDEIVTSEEAYLIQNREKTLSIELRNNNKVTNVVDFNDGAIVDFKASQFCWGTSKGYKVEILDLVSSQQDCGTNQYSSANKAKRKTDIGF